MIAMLKGTVFKIRHDSLILEVGGIGFEVFVGDTLDFRHGEELTLYTYLQNREDGQVLFGFKDESAHDLFIRLIKIKGIGPRTAVNMLTKMSASDMAKAIETGDLKTLKSLPGIGAKTASQIILDLKGQIVIEEKDERAKPKRSANQIWAETMEALDALGYKPAQIAFLDEEMSGKVGLSSNEMLKICLKKLAMASGL